MSTFARVSRRGLHLLMKASFHTRHFKLCFLLNVVPFLGDLLYIGPESPAVDANGNAFDLSTKLLHLAWHPTENSLACAAANSLYMYFA